MWRPERVLAVDLVNEKVTEVRFTTRGGLAHGLRDWFADRVLIDVPVREVYALASRLLAGEVVLIFDRQVLLMPMTGVYQVRSDRADRWRDLAPASLPRAVTG